MKKYWKTVLQFIKFGLVGASNTLISMIVYYACLYMGIYYIIAHTAGYIVGTLNAFYWNNKFVFKKQETERRSAKKSLVKSFLSYGITFLLSTGLIYIEVDLLGISPELAPIINLFITTPINFLLNKLWAFKGDKDNSEEGASDEIKS